MCGRYVLALRPSQVRQRLADQDMPAEDAPDDEDERIRQSYNFAPGYHGLIYRAATNDRGVDATPLEEGDGEPSPKKLKLSQNAGEAHAVDGHATKETKYKIQAAKWGLIPFWTKRSPDYGSMMRTINCRDDSLIENRGMWNTMKQRKRCIVVAEGFFEWLKKNNGKEKIPHYMRRKDGQLMCFAGLWDCVQYEGSEEKLYTYTIITTDSNKQLKFLHDRMPVILEPASENMKRWLDPNNQGWNKELQSMLKPFDGELECYPVDKAVGKVGNNSPSFVVPIDSKENKKNIANFFGNQKAKSEESKKEIHKKKDADDRETAINVEDLESNAPLPKPKGASDADLSQAIKQEACSLPDSVIIDAANQQVEKDIDQEATNLGDDDLLEAEKSPPRKTWTASPSSTRKVIKPESSGLCDEDLLEAEKSPPKKTWNATSSATNPTTPKKSAPANQKNARSATSNGTVPKTPTKTPSNMKITSFFGK